MNRLIPTLIALGTLACALPALGATGESESSAQKVRHELNSCMWRRMSADHLLSYNEAAKTCKQQLALRKPAAVQQLAANTATH